MNRRGVLTVVGGLALGVSLAGCLEAEETEEAEPVETEIFKGYDMVGNWAQCNAISDDSSCDIWVEFYQDAVENEAFDRYEAIWQGDRTWVTGSREDGEKWVHDGTGIQSR